MRAYNPWDDDSDTDKCVCGHAREDHTEYTVEDIEDDSLRRFFGCDDKVCGCKDFTLMDYSHV